MAPALVKPLQMHTSASTLFTVFSLLCFSSYLFHRGLLAPGSPSSQPATPPPSPTPQNLSILLWHWPFGRSYSLAGDPCRQMYNITGCLLSDNRSTFSTADVVVFHHHELRWGSPSSSSHLPLHLPRPPSQRWAWMSLEPPVNNGDLIPYNGLFNWTVSYRRDADVPIPYGRTVPHQGVGDRDPDGTPPAARNRSCLVSWVVSRYKPTQARSAVYQRLKRRVPVEVYGQWVRRPLADRDLMPTIGRCYFYLALENSCARDYISEKLWRNGLGAGAVPVVLGPSRATYEALAPPGSFIHVDDFGSVEALADHLRSVVSDDNGGGEAYRKYFRWQRTHEVKVYADWRERLCHICVRYPALPLHKVYHDLHGWVNS